MRPDFTKMTVDELRQLYVEKAGVSIEEAEQLKPKSALVEVLMKFYPQAEEPKITISNNSVFTQAEIEQSASTEEIEEVKNRPARGSVAWEEYVIDSLRDNEYIEKDGKKYPKSNGLRRLVEELLGPIVFSGPINVVSPNDSNRSNATVTYRLLVKWLADMGEIREFLEVADAGPSNTPEEYACHASATASSRAAGRAFRSALLLSVNTAEEMNKVVVGSGPTDDIRLLNANEPISGIQVVAINSIANRLGLNLEAVLTHNGYGSINSLNKEQGQSLMSQMNKYSSGELSIPDSIKESK